MSCAPPNFSLHHLCYGNWIYVNNGQADKGGPSGLKLSSVCELGSPVQWCQVLNSLAVHLGLLGTTLKKLL